MIISLGRFDGILLWPNLVFIKMLTLRGFIPAMLKVCCCFYSERTLYCCLGIRRVEGNGLLLGLEPFQLEVHF
jgi:hypothetical protein